MMRLRDITCISDLYYVIGRWFTVSMLLISMATLPFALEIWDSVWSFLMCGGIAFVGCAGDYKNSEHDVHYISAMVSAVCSIVWTAFVCPTALTVLMMAIVGLDDKQRWLLWCEIPCFLMVFGVLVVKFCPEVDEFLRPVAE